MDSVLKKIYRSALKFLVPLSMDETFELVVTEAMKLTKADYGTIYLENNGSLDRTYASSPFFYNIEPRNDGYTYTVFKKRKPILLSFQEMQEIHPQVRKLGVRSDMIVPLYNRGESMGVLSVMSKRADFFTNKHLNILNFFTPLASLAIRKNQLYDETKHALEVRDMFIAMASHELRTPLTSINGYIQLLHNKLSGSDSVESRWVEQLYKESIRLTNLANELLAINRIKAGQLQYLWKECSLREIIQRAIQNFSFITQDRTILFEDKLSTKKDLVIGDYDKLLQVMDNLLENAAKFSPPQTNIDLCLAEDKKFLIISIKDHGQGIKKEDISKVAEGMVRGSGQQPEGLGIGLFLVQNIIKEHRGTVKIQSKLNKGTIVTIKLPKAKS